MPVSVLYDHQIFCWQRYGGISRYFYEIANRLAGLAQTRVEIFAPFYVNDYFQKDSRLVPTGIKIPALARSGRILDCANGRLATLAVRRRRDVDIFHETYYSSFNNCPRSARRIVTVHDMIHEKFPDQFLARDNTCELKARAVNRADHVICISESTKRDLIELLNVAEDKITVVYHGASLAVSTEPERPDNAERPYILFVGMRGGYKNFAGLLNAYAASPQLRKDFDLVCFGGGDFSADEHALIKSLHFAGTSVRHVSGADGLLARFYAHASIFVFPSCYEGFGIPPLEALAYGCPVACSGTSSLPEVVGAAAELFDPADIEAIRSAIEGIVYSSARSQELIEQGRRRAAQFSWDRCALSTLTVYEKVLADHLLP